MKAPAFHILAGLATITAIALPATAAAKTYPKVGANKDRTIELVSTQNKLSPVVAAELSKDGERAVYRVFGGSDETVYGNVGALLADRTPTGWQSRSALPSRDLIGTPLAQLYAVSDDLRHLLAYGYRGSTGAFGTTLARYVTDQGVATRGYTTFAPARLGTIDVTSEDMNHVFITPGAPLIAADQGANGGLYDVGDLMPQLVGLLPGDLPPACGVSAVSREFPDIDTSLSSQHWASEDGSRVFFHTRGNDCTDPVQLYMREGGADGFTRLISGPPAAGPGLGARFTQATVDGSQVFFTTKTQLDPDDPNTGRDLYRYVVGEGSRCLTCVVADAQVENTEPPPSAGPNRLVVAETGERAYFVSSEALAAGATFGSRNLYVWRAGNPGTIGYVAPANATDGMVTSSVYNLNTATTPDGAVLIFRSSGPELNDLTTSDNGGFAQYYRYDDSDRSLVCVSCVPGGSTGAANIIETPGVTAIQAPRVVSDDGRSFVFTTDQALVTQDENGGRDIYEWRDGEIGLITDGQTLLTALTAATVKLSGISGDGRTVLFSSYDDLAPGVIEGSAQLYAARIGDGFPAGSVDEPCRDDQCQGAAVAQRPRSGLDSRGFSKPGEPPVAGRLVRTSRLTTRLTAAARFTIQAKVKAPGTVVVTGKYVRTVRRRVGRAGTHRITVRLTGPAARRLKARRKLRVGLRISTIFAARGASNTR